MEKVKKLTPYLKKKSVRAGTLPDHDRLQVFGVSNKLGITKTDYKRSKDLSKYQFIEAGDFAYNPYRINVGSIGLVPQNIKGLVSPAYVVFSTNNHLLSELLFDYLKSSAGLFQIGKYARGTVRKALRFDDLCQIEMPIPTLDRQRHILKKKASVQSEVNVLDAELTHQQTLLKKLRQRILQEAIEGRLTADWREKNPDVEPANELLARIQAEKEQLIKDKKIKKQKPLPAISEAEKPFDLPEGWVWCRLGEISDIKVGATPIRENPEYWNGDVNWVSSGEVANNYIEFTKETITTKGMDKSSAKISPKGSVLVAMIGQGKTRGQTAILNIDATTNQNVAAIRLSKEIIPEIVWYFFLSQYEATRSGASGGNQPALNGIKIKNTIFALPSTPEIKEIIERLKKIEPIIDQLQVRITENQTHAKQLMQAVLKEAFIHGNESSEKVLANA